MITKPAVTQLAKFFKATLKEFQEFWNSCSEEEKDYYRNAIAPWDGESEFV